MAQVIGHKAASPRCSILTIAMSNTLQTQSSLAQDYVMKSPLATSSNKGTQAIDWLIEQGVPFTKDHGSRAGFPSHAKVATESAPHHSCRGCYRSCGTSHLEQLVRKVQTSVCFEHHYAIDVITSAKIGDTSATKCLGLYVQDVKTGQVHTVSAQHTVLATGGAGKNLPLHTNPDTATGDGICHGMACWLSWQIWSSCNSHP